MRLVVILLAIAFCSCDKEESNPVFSSDVKLTSQEEVDAFGAKHYQSIEGKLTIGPSDDIQNLTSLSSIRTVQDLLYINDNSILETLDGLQNLEYANWVSISRNDKLESLDGLNIKSIGDHGLGIGQNKLLKNIDALSSLTLMEGGIEISENDSLKSIQGLVNITILDDLYIQENFSLQNLSGLENLSSVMGIISIHYNYSLTNLNELGGLKTIGGILEINDNYNLIDIDGLKNIETIGTEPHYVYRIEIVKNRNLLNLDGLTNVSFFYGNLNLKENQKLTDFCGLKAILNNELYSGEVIISSNLYNPTTADIIDGDCLI